MLLGEVYESVLDVRTTLSFHPCARALAIFPRHQSPHTDAITLATPSLIPRHGPVAAHRTRAAGWLTTIVNQRRYAGCPRRLTTA